MLVLVGLSFVAGLLTAFSPCVLPALPLVVGSAASERRWGPLALAGGLVVSFTTLGVLLAGLGPALGIEEADVRRLAAVLLGAAGVTLLVPRLQYALSRALAPVAGKAAALSGRFGGGLGAQFMVGALLGAIWSPCVGPTLGAAVGLASQGSTMPQAAAMMFAFGIGSAVPLLFTAYASRRMMAVRGSLLIAGARGKALMGVALIAMALATGSGIDRQLEAYVLTRLPQWWIDLIAGV